MTSSSISNGRLPNLLLIGAMKSGTTTLHSLLAQHPGLYMCEPKEPGFFSRDERYELGLPWYSTLFNDAQPEQLCGESSTCYTRYSAYPDAAARIAHHLPDVRLVFLMRHPVERIYSHYVHRMTERFNRRLGPVIPFEAALDEIGEIREASLYEFQLRQFEAYFPRDRFLLLSTDELREEPALTCRKVHTFLELPPLDPKTVTTENSQSNMFRFEAGDGTFLRWRRSSGGSALAKLLPNSIKMVAQPAIKAALRVASTGRKARAFREQLGRLSDAQRAALLDEFRGPNEALAEKWGFSIPSSWHE